MDTDGINWNIKVKDKNGKEWPNLYHLFGEFRQMYIENGHDPVVARGLALDRLREISKPEMARPNRYDF